MDIQVQSVAAIGFYEELLVELIFLNVLLSSLSKEGTEKIQRSRLGTQKSNWNADTIF